MCVCGWIDGWMDGWKVGVTRWPVHRKMAGCIYPQCRTQRANTRRQIACILHNTPPIYGANIIVHTFPSPLLTWYTKMFNNGNTNIRNIFYREKTQVSISDWLRISLVLAPRSVWDWDRVAQRSQTARVLVVLITLGCFTSRLAGNGRAVAQEGRKYCI